MFSGTTEDGLPLDMGIQSRDACKTLFSVWKIKEAGNIAEYIRSRRRRHDHKHKIRVLNEDRRQWERLSVVNMDGMSEGRSEDNRSIGFCGSGHHRGTENEVS